MRELASGYRWPACAALAAAMIAGTTLALPLVEYKSGKVWPEPKVLDPGPPGGPPADAVVLFDGKDLSAWTGGQQWQVADGVATVGKGSIETKQSFGDCQVHVEWATPEKVSGSGQGRGNSGVFLQGLYEVQILDSYDNTTYFDGQAGAIYKQAPPLVNVCRKPGEWQTFDIVFQGPRFDADGKLTRPAYLTVLQNGVLIQNHVELEGATAYDHAPFYTAHAARLPLMLQAHRNAVRYRNIWVRELGKE
jgi:hypothetical protein